MTRAVSRVVMRNATLGIRYIAGLAFAHLLTAVEVVAVAISLSGQTQGSASILLREKNLATIIVLIVLGTLVAVVGGAANIAPSLRWFVARRHPDPQQRRAAINMVRRQAAMQLATWIVSGAVVLMINVDADAGFAVLVGSAVIFGGASTVCTGLLFTQRTFRPIIAAASTDSASRETAPGVLFRLLTTWVVTSALPSATIVVLIVWRMNGWIIERTASVEVPVVVLSVISMFVGLRLVIVVSRSISDPVRDVVDGMVEVEHGRIGHLVDVYEQSEIGRLQSGFNRMVIGLKERDRLRDLFGRHVGADVARRAVEADETLSGDVREVAILFIDLAGSTKLAATRPPEEVAGVLNDFFRIVVAAVDQRHGLINKFQGDAALAVFGAPLRTDDPATAALATARILHTQLRRLPLVDFGIGISAGPVFAGNIGSENRYEYTVIGDPVNEAARLADSAKASHGRVLCSAAALARADVDEQLYWTSFGSAVLRGRSDITQMSAPVDNTD